MARLGLGPRWRCEFANDISPLKASAYRDNFADPSETFALYDINNIGVSQLPSQADLIWASFPCQDVSLAGGGKGLEGLRSGLIWKLLDICAQLRDDRRAPKIIALENVPGLLNSNQGQDFYDILEHLGKAGYAFGVLTMDAAHFLPQSRPRVFIVAVDKNQIDLPKRLFAQLPEHGNPWISERLLRLWKAAPSSILNNWLWWKIPAAEARTATLASVIDESADNWDSREYTNGLLKLMAPLHRLKVEKARATGNRVIGTLYRRTRVHDGIRAQRVEVRFDGISGCLRTPSGGSSRQRILVVDDRSVRSRLMTSREIARLMGLPDSYKLPVTYNDAYQLVGDGVAVPVVDWLSQHLLSELMLSQTAIAEDTVELQYA